MHKTSVQLYKSVSGLLIALAALAEAWRKQHSVMFWHAFEIYRSGHFSLLKSVDFMVSEYQIRNKWLFRFKPLKDAYNM